MSSLGDESGPGAGSTRLASLSAPATAAPGEFELIRRYFTAPCAFRPETLLGIGDDCALLRLGPDHDLAITADTLVSGVHFFPSTDSADVGYKALAVNLSDLAAVGAMPGWATLCLTLPAAETVWIEGFRDGFFDLASRYRMDLIGGDTTRGPLSITIQAMGLVSQGKALRRSGARAGDAICLTGSLGSAGLGLRILGGDFVSEDPEPVRRLLRPEPRVAAGRVLAGLAHAAIDLSDGLAADLGHVLTASSVGATLDWDLLPLSPEVRRYVAATGDWIMPLTAGDDYELCFTVSAAKLEEVEAHLGDLDCPCRRIGVIEESVGLRLTRNGRTEALSSLGFDHFRASRGMVG